MSDLAYMLLFVIINTIAFSLLERHFKFGKAYICDLVFGFLNPILITFSLSRLLRLYFTTAGGWAIIDLPALLPTWALWVVVIIFADFWGYLWHYTYHHSPLWRLHYVHHSSHDLRWHAILRFHPLESILTHLTLFIVLGMAGIPFRSYVIYNTIIFVFSALSHANVNWTYGWLGKIIISPVYHRSHHHEPIRKCNMGNILVIWDQLLGRAVFHDNNLPGPATPSDHSNWFKLMWSPFSRASWTGRPKEP